MRRLAGRPSSGGPAWPWRSSRPSWPGRAGRGAACPAPRGARSGSCSRAGSVRCRAQPRSGRRAIDQASSSWATSAGDQRARGALSRPARRPGRRHHQPRPRGAAHVRQSRFLPSCSASTPRAWSATHSSRISRGDARDPAPRRPPAAAASSGRRPTRAALDRLARSSVIRHGPGQSPRCRASAAT